MENRRLIVAVASGLICAISVFAFTQSVQTAANAQRLEALERFGGEQIEVCVATRDIAAGETPNSSCVTTRMWISDLLPKDPVTSLNEVSSQQLTSPVVQGEVISKRHFNAAGSVLDVPAGCCALSVPAQEVKAVGGAIASGMKVDVYLSGSSGISLLAHDIVVLATSVGDGESGGSSKIAWVTLAVEPKSVQEFIAASDKGSLYFVLPGEKPEKEASSKQEGESRADASTDKAAGSGSSDGESAGSGAGSHKTGSSSASGKPGASAGSDKNASSKASSSSSEGGKSVSGGKSGKNDADAASSKKPGDGKASAGKEGEWAR